MHDLSNILGFIIPVLGIILNVFYWVDCEGGGRVLLIACVSFVHFYFLSDDGQIERPKHVVEK